MKGLFSKLPKDRLLKCSVNSNGYFRVHFIASCWHVRRCVHTLCTYVCACHCVEAMACVGCRDISINITICILHNVYSVVDGITALSCSCEGYSPHHTAEQNEMLLHRMHYNVIKPTCRPIYQHTTSLHVLTVLS